MPTKVAPIQTTFNGGIQSPLLGGHVNAPRRDSSSKDSVNLLALKHGPLVRRGGTKNVYESIWSNTDAQLVPFNFNDEESYMIEFSSGFIRIYKHEGVVVVSGSDRTISSVTAASPPVVTTTANHDFVNGNWVNFTDLTEAIELNDRWGRVANKTATAFEVLEGDLSTPFAAPAVAETSSTGNVNTSFFLAIPYDTDDLFDSDGLFRLDVVQSNDVMFISHPDFTTRILARTADDAWTITKMTYKNGPYLRINSKDTTMTVSSVASRVVTITCSVADTVVPSDTLSAAAGGDANDLGTATEVNRMMMMNVDNDDVEAGDGLDIPKLNKWIWGGITKYLTTTTFEWTIDDDSKLANADLTTSPANPTYWRLSAYSDTTGFPSVVDIHEGRLVVGSNTDEPRRVDFSVINGFSPTDSTWDPYDFTRVVRPDDGFTSAVGGGNAAPVQWVRSTDKGLFVGTNNSEGVIRSSVQGESLTPDNASYKAGTTIGSRTIQPLYINGALLFVQFVGRRLHELTYTFQTDSLVAPDMIELAEHLTRGKPIIEIVYQQQPINTVWCLLSDGTLLGFTYERNSDILGWHRHVVGGTDTKIKSIGVLPVPSENRDELWMTVSRTINGQTKFLIEKMERWYEDDIEREDIYHMDGGLSYVSTKITITGATAADPVVVTSAAHGRSNGDKVYIKDVVGMTELNQQTYIVANKTATTMELQDLNAVDIDGTAFTAYTSGGTLQESVTTFRALNYLEGETMQVIVDGNAHDDLTISNGAITLADGLTGANVSAGFPADWIWEPLPWDFPTETGSGQGRKQRVNKIILRLLDTLGLKYSETTDNLFEEEFDNAVTMNQPTPLFSGDLTLNWPGSSGVQVTAHFTGDGPFPVQIQSVSTPIKTQEQRT